MASSYVGLVSSEGEEAMNVKKVWVLSTLFLLIGLGYPFLGSSGELKVIPKLEKEEVSLGERTKLEIAVLGEGVTCDSVIFPAPQLFPRDVYARDLNDCKVVDGGVARDYEIAVFSLDPKIDNLSVFVGKREEKVPPIRIKVKQNLPNDVSKVEPRPYAGLYAVRFPWKAFALILLAIILSSALFVWWFSRRKRKEDEGSPVRPYWEVARDRLKALKKSSLVELGHFRKFYYDLTEILRYYIQHRFGIPAMEMTNTEFLMVLNRLDLPSDVKDRLRDLIRRSGPVKYAQESVSPEECYRDLELVESIVVPPKDEQRDDNSPSHS